MTVRDIGAMLDSALTMESHIKSVKKSCYHQIRNISKIRKYLSEDAAKTLVNAFVTSRLDNMNALLYNLPNSQIEKLQMIQNNSARVIKKCKKSDHITPHLFDLHWLPINYRIKYKILLIVYKCLHGEGPEYIASLLEQYQPPRALRSASQHRLRELRAQKKYGERAFSRAGPKLWNELPFDIKCSKSKDIFKKALKTYFFKTAYNL